MQWCLYVPCFLILAITREVMMSQLATYGLSDALFNTSKLITADHFQCLTVKAVYLGVTEILSTDAFILRFRNFVNYCKCPVALGVITNFIDVQKMLRKKNKFLILSGLHKSYPKRTKLNGFIIALQIHVCL